MRFTRRLPSLLLLTALTLAPPMAVMAATEAAQEAATSAAPAAAPERATTPAEERDGYAAREAQSQPVAAFKGGDSGSLYIGGGAVAVLLIVLIVVLIV